MKNLGLGVLTAVVAATVLATDFTGWLGEGNPDLANPATWGLEEGLPTDAINIKASGYTFEASKDVTFKAIYMSKASITNVFKLAPGRTITLNNGVNGYALCGGANGGYVNMQTTFDGGTWDVGKGIFCPIYHYSYAPRGNTFILDNGCIVTNVGTFRVSYGNNALNCTNRVTIKGGSQLHVGAAAIITGWGFDNTFEVLDGLFTWSSGNPSLGANGATGNVFRISGPNARVKNLGGSYPCMGGAGAYNNTLMIENDAEWDNGSSSFAIGRGVGDHDEKVIVRDGGKLIGCGDIYLNQQPGAYDSSLQVLNGGEVQAKIIAVGYHATDTRNTGASVFVSNATLRCARIYPSGAIASNQVVRIMGSNTVFETSHASTYPLFSKGSFCTFSLEEGAVWNFGYHISTGYTSDFAPSNRVQILSGAKLNVTDIFSVGYGSTYTDGHLVMIGDRAELNCTAYRYYAHDNTTIVSNGLLNVTGTLSMGFDHQNTGFTNNTLVVQGTRPRVRAGVLQVREWCRVCFDIPADGYDPDNVPIECGAWNDYNATTFEFPGLAAYQQSLVPEGGTKAITLAKVTGSSEEGVHNKFDWRVANAVKAANAKMPPKCKLSLANDDTELVLTVRPDAGLMLIVR